MANIQLIRDILADKANEYTIYDIFSEDELEYENEIIFYALDSFDLTGDEILNDQYVRDEELMDDAEKMTDERRISHGLRYLNAAIKKSMKRMT